MAKKTEKLKTQHEAIKFFRENLFATGILSAGIIVSIVGFVCIIKSLIENFEQTAMTLLVLSMIWFILPVAYIIVGICEKHKKNKKND